MNFKKPPDPLAGVPLHNLEIEQGLLGALLLSNVNFDMVAGKLQPEHFVEPLHQVLFGEIARKIGLAEPATPLTVRGSLPVDLDVGGMTGPQYLARLAAEATVGMNVPHYGDTIMQYKAAREHVLNARDLIDGCMGGVPVDEALKVFHDQSEAVRNGYLGPGLRDTSRSIGETMDKTIERMSAAMRHEPMALGIPTCLVELDALIGGLQRGNLVVIAGRPSMGKSSVAVSVARQIALRGYGVGIQSLEMDEPSLGSRLAADHAFDPRTRIAYNSMIHGNIGDHYAEIILNAACDLKAAPIEFDFATSMTVAEVSGSARRMASRLKKEKNVDLAVLMIDYLKFVKATSRYAGQKHYEIGEITAALKGLARQLGICVVLFHQLNRVVEATASRRPGMEHLRESGDVEQDADVVILLYREAYYIDRSGDMANPAKEAEAAVRKAAVEFDLDMIVAKQRMGPAKDVRVFCDIGCSAVRSPPPPLFAPSPYGQRPPDIEEFR